MSLQGLWHLAPDGECGAITAMAACNNGPGSCDYQTVGGASPGLLRSPTFQLTGTPPWTITFDYLKDTDASGDIAWATIELWGDDGIGDTVALLPDAGTVQHVVHVEDYNEVWWGESVKLQFFLGSDGVGDLGSGLLIDNVVVTNSGGWTDLGHAKAGSAGTPSLAGTGTLAASSANQLTLTDARPNAAAVLFFGLNDLNAPFKGGVLVPVPQFTIPLPTGPAGTASLPFVFPAGVPDGLDLYFQVWIPDHAASQGVAASNGLLGITP
jgi:hypothetical protein